MVGWGCVYSSYSHTQVHRPYYLSCSPSSLSPLLFISKHSCRSCQKRVNTWTPFLKGKFSLLLYGFFCWPTSQSPDCSLDIAICMLEEIEDSLVHSCHSPDYISSICTTLPNEWQTASILSWLLGPEGRAGLPRHLGCYTVMALLPWHLLPSWSDSAWIQTCMTDLKLYVFWTHSIYAKSEWVWLHTCNRLSYTETQDWSLVLKWAFQIFYFEKPIWDTLMTINQWECLFLIWLVTVEYYPHKSTKFHLNPTVILELTAEKHTSCPSSKAIPDNYFDPSPHKFLV